LSTSDFYEEALIREGRRGLLKDAGREEGMKVTRPEHKLQIPHIYRTEVHQSGPHKNPPDIDLRERLAICHAYSVFCPHEENSRLSVRFIAPGNLSQRILV